MGILEALEMAQKRNKERDVMNTQRQMPVLPIIPTGEVQPIRLDTGGGDGPPMTDTRTPHQQYLDAIDANQYVGAIPVVGTFLGAMNDSYIENYERENPDKITGGGVNKYSMSGRAMGRGLSPEEEKMAEEAGLGLRRGASYGLLDRITGNVPINWATQGDYMGSFPEGIGGSTGWETGSDDNDQPAAAVGTQNWGGRESMVDEEDYSRYA